MLHATDPIALIRMLTLYKYLNDLQLQLNGARGNINFIGGPGPGPSLAGTRYTRLVRALRSVFSLFFFSLTGQGPSRPARLAKFAQAKEKNPPGMAPS